MANTYLQRNMANSLTTDWTVSMWVKRNEIVRQQMLFSAYNNSTHDTEVFFDGDKLNFRNKRGGSFVFQVKTNRLFRDTNSFYHLVFQFHASGDSGVYAKIFVNGVQETDLNVNTQGSGETTWNNDKSHSIGSTVNGGADHFNGIISHMHFASTGIYAPTVFGEYDANGVWKIKTSPSFTLGTNGFTILKDGNTITDQSSNSNNWSASGTLTKTEDSPSNVFATMNPLDATGCTLSLGNNRTAFSSSFKFAKSTLGWSAGKYYMEAKASTITDRGGVGIVKSLASAYNDTSIDNNRILYHSNGNVYTNVIDGGSTSVATISQGDIVGIEVDMTAGTCKFYKNGSAIHTVTSSIISDNEWQFLVGGLSINWDTNFGNGYFGTTAVASAGTNASGIGIFEYDVPTGYTALSTKGLNL